MSQWFPDVSEYEGAKKALNGGFYACLAFAAMNVLGIVFIMLAAKNPSSGEAVTQMTGAIFGVLVELTIVLIAAWRFKREKGLIWGTLALLLFALEVFMKVAGGTTNVGWIFFYAAIFAGLANGLRGAWAIRSNEFVDIDAETFS
ncbi:hypothetical protein [Tsuneonella mangrovi]|uniref:hypothetical protein n=1 Tax=Tsuneonella mangrovi TaxID=1982042 RepID=UPI000BA1E6B4|nr:hypothetical protein [Tsuneonella mangrovi]